MNEITKKVYKEGYKPSNPQSLQHINAVKAAYNYILMGGTSSATKDALRNDLLGLGIEYSKAQTDRIYLEARELIIADFDEDRTFCKSKLLACLNDIYTDAKEANDRYNAISAVKEMAKLLNLYETNNKNVTVKTNDTEITISFGLDNDDDNVTDAEIIE